MTDPISDMLTRIRNAYMAKHSSVEVPHSELKEQLAQILKTKGYLNSIEMKDNKPKKMMHIKLRYIGKLPAIDGIERISKPGRRLYARANNIPKTLGGVGSTIVSTSKGLMTDEQARKQKIGGEIICRVW